MRNIVVCSSHRGMSSETLRAFQSLLKEGWAGLLQEGCPDVALARNMALSLAMPQVDNSRDSVVLMIDDDMVFEPGDAKFLTELARSSGDAWSAIYTTSDGRVAAAEWSEDRYLTGLGFLAIPGTMLWTLERENPKFVHNDREHSVWCSTGIREHKDGPSTWMSEDFCLTARLGGVRLAKLGVGHLKRVPIYPDEQSVERFSSQSPF